MNKVVLITGGARGIGSAIALELAKHGYDIVINYLTSKQPAKELKEKIESQMQYPGTIKVTVIRETRATEEAK